MDVEQKKTSLWEKLSLRVISKRISQSRNGPQNAHTSKYLSFQKVATESQVNSIEWGWLEQINSAKSFLHHMGNKSNDVDSTQNSMISTACSG